MNYLKVTFTFLALFLSLFAYAIDIKLEDNENYYGEEAIQVTNPQNGVTINVPLNDNLACDLKKTVKNWDDMTLNVTHPSIQAGDCFDVEITTDDLEGPVSFRSYSPAKKPGQFFVALDIFEHWLIEDGYEIVEGAIDVTLNIKITKRSPISLQEDGSYDGDFTETCEYDGTKDICFDVRGKSINVDDLFNISVSTETEDFSFSYEEYITVQSFGQFFIDITIHSNSNINNIPFTIKIEKEYRPDFSFVLIGDSSKGKVTPTETFERATVTVAGENIKRGDQFYVNFTEVTSESFITAEEDGSFRVPIVADNKINEFEITIEKIKPINIELDQYGNYDKTKTIPLEYYGSGQQVYLNITEPLETDKFYYGEITTDVENITFDSFMIDGRYDGKSFPYHLRIKTPYNVDSQTFNLTIKITKELPFEIELDQDGTYSGSLTINSPETSSDLSFIITGKIIKTEDFYQIMFDRDKFVRVQAKKDGELQCTYFFNSIEDGKMFLSVSKLDSDEYVTVTKRYHGAGFMDDYCVFLSPPDSDYVERMLICDSGTFCDFKPDLYLCTAESSEDYYYEFDTILLDGKKVSLDDKITLTKNVIIDYKAKAFRGNKNFDAFDLADNIPYGATELIVDEMVKTPRTLGEADNVDWYKVQLLKDSEYLFVANAYVILYSYDSNTKEYDETFIYSNETYTPTTTGFYYVAVENGNSEDAVISRNYQLICQNVTDSVIGDEDLLSISVDSLRFSINGGTLPLTVTNHTNVYQVAYILNLEDEMPWLTYTHSLLIKPDATQDMQISVTSLDKEANSRTCEIVLRYGNSSSVANVEIYQSNGLLNQLTVNGGDGGGRYGSKAVVRIVAHAAPAGKVFDCWTSESDTACIKDTKNPITTITLTTEEYTVTAIYKNDTETTPAGNTIQLISKNGSTVTSYNPGGSDIVLIKAPPSTEMVVLKCSGLTYGVDFVLGGHSPEGNNFNMTIDQLRQGVVLSFLNGGATKVRTFKITLTAPTGWTVDKTNKLLTYSIGFEPTTVTSFIAEEGQDVSVDTAKDFLYKTAQIVNVHTNSGSYNPEDGLLTPNPKTHYGWLDAIVDEKGNGVNIYSGKKNAPKQTMTIDAIKIPEMKGGAFDRSPSFKNVTYDPFSKTPLKPKKTSISYNKKTNVVTFKPSTKLYSARQIKDERKGGKMIGQYSMCDTQRGSQIIFSYKDKAKNIAVKEAPMGAIIISSPDKLTIEKTFASSNGRDSIIRVKGNFLGASPKAFYEYFDSKGKVKTANCKVKLYKKAGPDQVKVAIESQMGADGSYKTMDITLPTLPRGAKATPCHLIIDNGLGYGEFKNAPQLKIKQ